MAWLVPLVPLLAALLLAGVGRDGMDGEPPRGRLAVTAAAAMALTAGVAAFAAWAGWTGRLPWSESLGLSLDYAPATSPVAALFAVLVPVVAAPVLAYGAGHEEGRGLTRLLAVLAFFVAAMEVVAGAADLLTLLLGWELIGACSAVLIAHHWRDGENPRAGSIVFVTTRAGDLGLFLALGAAFAGVGSLEYGALGGLDGLHLHLVVAGVLVAAAAKSAQVPFAPWLFVAMKGPVTVSSLLHAATMVAAGAFLLIRLHTVLDTAPWFGAATMAVGLTTALMAGVVALLQSHAKRLLAGSTSAHYGLMFLAVGAGYPAVAALHLVAHALAKAPLFLATGIAHECAGSYELWRMELRRVLPGIATATLVVAGAIAGLPPLGAAWTKEAVVTTAGHAAPWVAVAAALAGALSAAYMARFFFQAFGTGSTARDGRSPRSLERWPLYLLAAATVALGVLWLPPLHGAAGHLLDGEIPPFRPWEVAVSLGLVALGVLTGWEVARRRPGLGWDVAAGPADWLGLPALARQGVVRPGRLLAHALARVDDAAVDGAVRGVRTGVAALAGAVALFDDRIVDGGVRLTAAVGRGLAWLGQRPGEALFDGVPESASRLVAWGGAQARRLQTGLAHHYYRLVVAGLAAVLVLLILGG